jgi:hypothetical protein
MDPELPVLRKRGAQRLSRPRSIRPSKAYTQLICNRLNGDARRIGHAAIVHKRSLQQTDRQ